MDSTDASNTVGEMELEWVSGTGKRDGLETVASRSHCS